MKSRTSRKIFLYLAINLAFMFVELIVGKVKSTIFINRPYEQFPRVGE